MSKRVLAIGEALIDFIPDCQGCQIKDVDGFYPKVGGAPLNVCGAVRALGGESAMITMLGEDPFGDKIVSEMEQYGISTEYVLRTDRANTSLAFVSLQHDGNREFSFYRNPGADMLLAPEDIREEWFDDCFGLHFCSVSLGDFPMKEATRKAAEFAAKRHAVVSFDPNLRFPLWKDRGRLKEVVLTFIPYANVLKISDEELSFITGMDEIEAALKMLFAFGVELVIYTKGADGAECYTKKNKAVVQGKKLHAVDTTGAGDGFIGAFLYSMACDGIDADGIQGLSAERLETYLRASNAFCAESVMRKGAIASYFSDGFGE